MIIRARSSDFFAPVALGLRGLPSGEGLSAKNRKGSGSYGHEEENSS
jgi:hypothetical protein